MQKKIAEQENQLATLEAAQGINRRQYDELSSNRTKTEQDLAQLMRFLWPVFVGQESIGARDGVAWAEADAETKGGHAFRVIAAYARWFAGAGNAPRELAALRLLGFFDRPATPENLAALRAAPAIAGLTEALIDA